MNSIIESGVAAVRPLPKGHQTYAATPTKPKRKATDVVPDMADCDLPSASPNLRVTRKTNLARAIAEVPNLANLAVPKQDPSAELCAAPIVPTAASESRPTQPIIDTLRELHRQRQDIMRAEVALTLRVKAICRRLCDGDRDAADVKYRQILAAREDGEQMPMVEPFFAALDVMSPSRRKAEKDMEKTVKLLPIAPWVESINGFGMGGLAAIVGECGDLNNYPTHSHLWKRMGLAVIDGERQRRVAGVDALKHGYSPTRRSIMWNIGQSLFKAQSQRVNKETGEVIKPAGRYRVMYDQRKELELARCETKIAAHNRAMRWVEKRLLRDLYNAWRALG